MKIWVRRVLPSPALADPVRKNRDLDYGGSSGSGKESR